MKIDEVPQDNNSIHCEVGRKAVYAVDENNNYKVVQTTGWEVEEIVTKLALDDLAEKEVQALKNYKNGVTSILEYYMYRSRMDLQLLSQTTGFFQWRIKRHMRPEIFKKLNNKILNKYASVFDISIGDLNKTYEEVKEENEQ